MGITEFRGNALTHCHGSCHHRKGASLQNKKIKQNKEYTTYVYLFSIHLSPETVYEVVVSETDVSLPTPASTSANLCVSTTVPNSLFTAVSNVSATGGSSVMSRTKQ